MQSASAPPCPVPVAVSNAVDMLVSRAKSGRSGVFWPVGVNYRQVNPAQFENSLGYGTPGVLLSLLEYYRCTQDKEIADLLHKGLAWVLNKAKLQKFWPGFYGGTAGVWFLCKHEEASFPGVCGPWRDDAREVLAKPVEGDCAANLTWGVGGTLVGAMCALDPTPDDARGLFRPLVTALVAAAKPSPRGVFWDFNPTSIRPPVGFTTGNAGIDYCLIHLRRLGIAHTALLGGSLAHANTLFDPQAANWLDQDASLAFKRLRPADVERALAKGNVNDLAKAAPPEDSISWGQGTTGVLLSRASVAAAANNLGPLAELARKDCRLAIDRLSRVSEEDLAALDSSLAHGLAGLVGGLDCCLRVLSSPENGALKVLRDRAKVIFDERKAAIEDEDVSLLTGAAGFVYAHCRPLAGMTGPGCLDPLSAHPPVGASPPEGDLEPFFQRRLPAAAGVLEIRSALTESETSLGGIDIAAADLYQRDPDGVLTKSIRHEASLYDELSRTCFQALFWREAANRACVAREGIVDRDEALLFGRFRVNEAATLFAFDFDPHARCEIPPRSKVYILRNATSTGVVEAKISPLQHALLVGFADGAIALEVIRDVIKRVETPDVTARQLAELSMRMIRGFLQGGGIVPAPANALSGWLVRKRLGKTRKVLFPQAKG